MSEKALATEHEAREVAEHAREQDWEHRSFARSIFEGSPRLDLVHPHPEPDAEEQERGAEFLERLERFAAAHIDGDAIDREGAIRVMNALGGAAKGRDKHSDIPLRVNTVYDETRARLKVMATGSLATATGLLQLMESMSAR